jgi:LmbE family N-acetylglucosaminyl deacetylase
MTTAADYHRAWRELPPGCLDDIIGGGICLILAPHPDDESLGCGGLIARCVEAGRMPLVAVLTDGAGSHPNSAEYPAHRLREVRAREVRTAVARLGLPADRVILLGEPDTAAPRDGSGFHAVVGRLVALLPPVCTAILAPWRYDPHCDHEAASLAAAAVADRTLIRHVAYPVWGWTLPAAQVVPGSPGQGWRLDIADVLPRKRSAIQAHQSQYGDLITDDPSGFQLPAELLAVFDSRYETFLEP